MSVKVDEHIIAGLIKWKQEADASKKDLRLFVGVDIGGTNTRVALASSVSDGFIEVIKFQCKDSQQLVEKLTLIANQIHNAIQTIPVGACLDAAGPIEGGIKVTITNYENHRDLSVFDLPQLLFPHNKTVFVNDLESACEGISALNSENRLHEYFQPLWGPENIQLRSVNYLVLAMGTGLGTGVLVAKRGKQDHEVLALEFGHTFMNRLGIKNAEYEQESKIVEYISNKVWKGEYTLEYEDICSGRGLSYVYEALTNGSVLSAAEVTEKANSGDEVARKAVLYHYKYLMRNAQTLCVGLQAKGVFLAGDNQVRNDTLVVEMAKELQQEFVNHSKREWVEGVPVFRQIKSYNLNLHGCLFVAKRL